MDENIFSAPTLVPTKQRKFNFIIVSKTNCISCSISKGQGTIYNKEKPLFNKENRWNEQFFIDLTESGIMDVTELVFSDSNPLPNNLQSYKRFKRLGNKIEYEEFAGTDDDKLGYRLVTRENEDPDFNTLGTSFSDTQKLVVPNCLTNSVLHYPGFIIAEDFEWERALSNPVYFPKFYTLGYIHAEINGGWVIHRENINTAKYNLPDIVNAVENVVNGVFDMKVMPPLPEPIPGVKEEEPPIGNFGFDIDNFNNGLNFAMISSSFRSLNFNNINNRILQNMREDLGLKENEITRLLSEVEKISSEIDILSKTLETKDKEIEKLKNNSDNSLPIELEILKMENSKQGKDLLEKEKLISAYRIRIDAQNNILNQRAIDIEEKNKELCEKVEELEKTNFEYGMDLVKMEELPILKEELGKAKINIAINTEKYESKINEIERLKQELSSLKYENELLRKDKDEIKESPPTPRSSIPKPVPKLKLKASAPSKSPPTSIDVVPKPLSTPRNRLNKVVKPKRIMKV